MAIKKYGVIYDYFGNDFYIELSDKSDETIKEVDANIRYDNDR